MLSENPTLAEVQEYFALDRFATIACGATVVSAARGHAVCEMTIQDVHKNAMNNVMGGATFTLADFALAIACNVGEAPTVSISNTIQFLAVPHGQKLIAECQGDKSGRTVGFYTVTVRDDTGSLIAKMLATCSRQRR